MNQDFDQQNREMEKLKSLSSSSLMPLMILRSRYHHHHQATSPPYASRSRENLPSQENLLMTHLRASSQLPLGFSGVASSRRKFSVSPAPHSAVQKLEVVDDDVLVMDEVLVTSASDARKVRKSGLDSSSGGGSVRRGYRASSGGWTACKNKEICEDWDCFGRSQVRSSESYTRAGSYTYSLVSPLTQQVMSGSSSASSSTPLAASPASAIEDPTPTFKPELTDMTDTPISKPDNTCKTLPPNPTSTLQAEPYNKTTPILNQDWSPVDDGIEVRLPFHSEMPPSRAEIDTYIQDILYGPTKTKTRRLPVFLDICLDVELPTSGEP